MRTQTILDIGKLNDLLLTQQMYFYNDFEQCVVRSQPNEDGLVDYWIKFKGQLEFKSGTSNTILFETVHIDCVVISEKDYNSF